MANCGPLIPIPVTIVIDDVDTELAAGWDKIKIERSTQTSAGPFQEITNSKTRMDLVSDQTIYEFTDPAGNGYFWYRYVLYNSTTEVSDTPSEAALGEQDAALDIITVDEIKTHYLFGVNLTDDSGKEYPDSLFAHYIKAAVASVEHRLKIQIRRKSYEEESHDFYREDYNKYIWMELDHFPVISIEEVKMVLPGEQVVKTFDKDWIHIQRFAGHLQLVPGTGTSGSILLGASGAWLPFIYGNNKFIPDAFRVTYTAGFGKPPEGSWGFAQGSNPASVSKPDADLDYVPQDLKHLVGMLACFGPLNIAGDLIVGAGIASSSLSIDGLSQSVSTTSSATNAGYGSRLIQYGKEIKELLPALEKTYNGVRLQVV